MNAPDVMNPSDYIKPVCECEQCNAEIYEGGSIVKDADQHIFCEESCLVAFFYENGIIESATAV